MHQIRFPLGSTPDPAGRAYSAPPDLSDVFKGLLLRAGRGIRRKGKGKDKGKRRGNEVNGKGREGKGREGRRGEGICRTSVKLLPTLSISSDLSVFSRSCCGDTTKKIYDIFQLYSQQ